MPSYVTPLSQAGRPPCSLPMEDADLGLDNANWTKGLQAMSDWIWSANLNPAAFPNNLARFFLHVPAIFEQQLHYSTSLLFDEPSFRNGVQVSGFISRPLRELVINFIGQHRRCWYTMTHHAILGTLTAAKHGLPTAEYARKLTLLTDYASHENLFSTLEREVLKFAECFSGNPKRWTDADCERLKEVFRAENRRRFAEQNAWLSRLDVARAAARGAVARGDARNAYASAKTACEKEATLSEAENGRLVDSQLVELAFVCLQFVALTDVFTALNVPDESFLPDVMTNLLDPALIARINELNRLGGEGMDDLLPPKVSLPLQDIASGLVSVAPAPLRGARVNTASYETDTAQATRDKGIAVGGVQAGVWGWSFGNYFPGGLIYLLMNHPELARFESAYSLPLLFNEDEWRNGVNTGGFTPRRLRELVFQKIYVTTRSRYGLEHHQMYFVSTYLDEYGVGRPPNPPLSEEEKAAARSRALEHAGDVILYLNDTALAPAGVYSDLDLAIINWVEKVISVPHEAHRYEKRLRHELDIVNRREVEAGLRVLDTAPGIGADAAFRRLLDHQIAELAMMTGHMNGLGRAMTMLRLESEPPVAVKDGYLTDRIGWFDVLKAVGVPDKALTANELRLNPKLLADLKSGKQTSPVSGDVAARTGEF